MILLKRGNKSNIPILNNGEIGVTLDSNEIFIGNGSINSLIGVRESYLALTLTSIPGTKNTNTLVNWTQERVIGNFLTYSGGYVNCAYTGRYRILTNINLNCNSNNFLFSFTLYSSINSNIDYKEFWTTANSKAFGYNLSNVYNLQAGEKLNYYLNNTNATSTYNTYTPARFIIQYIGT